ncbi:MAG TPA: DUF6325 family protein [Marmoricola sp.]|nr:DUF6325 family protein [Marmoricola sp.]
MAELDDVYGPVDFVLLEFTGDRLTGKAAKEVLRLVDSGIIRLYDVAFVGKRPDGEVYALDAATEFAEESDGFKELTGARSGLLGDDEIRDAAEAMEPGTLAVLIIYENRWAARFIAAAREAGGELVAAARISGTDIMDALDALDERDTPLQTAG